MKPLLLAAGLALAVAAADAQEVPAPGETRTADVIDNVVATRNARVIYVLPFGQFWHRYDHILASGQIELKPEEAIVRGYSRCPECLPPRSTEELNAELSTGGPKRSRYYVTYLSERKEATITNVPPGSLPVLDPVAPPSAPRGATPAAAPAAPSAPAKR